MSTRLKRLFMPAVSKSIRGHSTNAAQEYPSFVLSQQKSIKKMIFLSNFAKKVPYSKNDTNGTESQRTEPTRNLFLRRLTPQKYVFAASIKKWCPGGGSNPRPTA